MFNYIWYVNGWYIRANHFEGQNGRAAGVSICPKPFDSKDYPVTMWCFTCKKKCPTSKLPYLPTPTEKE
jgi:hypothetical protein